MSKILVFIEIENGKVKRASLESVSAANYIAGSLNAEVVGVAANASENAVSGLAEWGLKNIVVAKNDNLNDYSSTAFTSMICQVADSEGAEVVIMPANATGKELAPRVAARLNAGYVSDCIGLNVDGGEIIAKKPVYAGKAIVNMKADSPKKVFSLRPNVFTAQNTGGSDISVKEMPLEISDNDLKVKVTSVSKNEGKMDVLEADIVVSGGRGLKGPEHFHLVEGLAKAFGGAVGASRAVVDAGWRPHAEQVGQTGKTVSPSLYVACAISGAVQHLAGMSSSKYILAINKDKDAPIFKVADYGIVGDVFEIIPKVTEKVAEITGN